MSNTPFSRDPEKHAEPRPGDNLTFFEMLAAALYLHRKLLAWGLAALFATSIVVAVLAKKEYTSSSTIQITMESGSKLGGLAEGLKMLDPRSGNSKGIGTALAILDSRQMAVSMIQKFDLKKKYHTTWDHLAIRKFQKQFAYETYDENIVEVSFKYGDPDSSKLILDTIMAYLNAKTIEFTTSKARQEFLFNQRQVDSVYWRIDSLQIARNASLKRNNIVDLESNLQLSLRSYGVIQQSILALESQYAMAKIDNRVSLQEKQNLQAQIESLKKQRRQLLTGGSAASRSDRENFDLSISYDSIPSMVAEEAKFNMLAERDKAILKILLPKLEESRLQMVETTPIISVIDPSFVPPYKSGPKRAVIILGITLGGGLLLTILLVLIEFFRNPAFQLPGLKGFMEHVRRLR